MRKRLRFAILSIIAAAIAGRVSLGWPIGRASAAETLSATADAMVVAQASGQRVSSTMMRLLPGLPDAAKLFLMGGVLFSLAAAVRRVPDTPAPPLIAAQQQH